MPYLIIASENRRLFTTPPLVSPRNDVWATSAEIPYWWRVTTQIWEVLLIGWRQNSPATRPIRSTTHWGDLVCDASLVWNFCSRCSVMAARNVGCFLRLFRYFMIWEFKYNSRKRAVLKSSKTYTPCLNYMEEHLSAPANLSTPLK